MKEALNDMISNDTPYIDPNGTIIIPFAADSKYHYWNGGQPLAETLLELNVTENVWGKHIVKPYPGKLKDINCGKSQ